MSLPIPPSINKGQIALDPINGIVYYKDDNENLVATTWSWLRDDMSAVSTDDDVTITGNLTVSGTTVSVNVETVTVADNILILNSNVTGAPTENAGIEIERGTSSNVSIRWNESNDKWELTTDGTTYKEINGTATEALSWASPITLSISGDVTGSVSFDGSENVSLSATVVNDSHTHNASSLTFALEDASDVSFSGVSDGDFLRYNGSNWINDPVNLATDTVGDYVAKLAAGTGITITNNSGEGATPNISFSGSIDSVSDVVITSAANGQLLEYNGTNWVNAVRPSSEPIGHEDKSDSVISFNESTREFSIAPSSTSYTVWCTGKRYVKTSTETVQIPDTSGLYYIYFNSSGSLAYKTTFFTWDEDTPTAYVYWNEVDNKAYFFADERHGITLDWATHEYLHRTRGAAIANGFGANNYTLTGDGSLDAHAKIDIANGTFFDEDLQVDIEHSASPTANTWQQRLQSGAYIPVFYKLNNHWTKDVATQFPVKNGGTRAQYNLNTAGTWSNASIDNSKYGVMFLVATNNLNEPVLAIMGQEQYTDQGSAEASTWDELDLGGFPIVEFRPLYKIVFQTATAYANSPKTRFVNLLDLRRVIPSGDSIPTTPVSDHGNMTGLSDDDHTQYLTEARHDAHDHSTAMSSVVLDDISDIEAATPSNDQVLTWDSSLSKWTPQTFSATVAGLDNIGDVNAPSPSSGDYLKWNGTDWVNDAISLDELNDTTVPSPSSGDYLKWNGTAWVNDPINLGSDTIGNYLSDITAGTGVGITHTPGEGSSAEISIGQDVSTSATPTFAGISLTGTTSLQQSLEKTTAGGNLTGTTNVDLLTSAIYTYTGTGDFTFNFRGSNLVSLNSLMLENQSITAVLFVTNTTARTLSAIQVEGAVANTAGTNGVTLRWFGGTGTGTAPSGNASATDVYTITIIKTGSGTYTVYASQSKFA
jgi:hypothetical protein